MAMGVMRTLSYIAVFPEIRFGLWKMWRRRNAFFKRRDPVNLDAWPAVFHKKGEWDANLCRFVLDVIGSFFIVDPRQIRPTDRFDDELRMPTTWYQREASGDAWEIFIEVIANRRKFDKWPEQPEDMREGSVAQLLDYLNAIWTMYPKQIDHVSGMRVERETDG